MALRRLSHRKEVVLCDNSDGADKKMAAADTKNRIANMPDTREADGVHPMNIARHASLEG
jgi:hypothetical protein